MQAYGHWINGTEVAPVDGGWIETEDPYRGTVWARIARGTAADADRAVAAAKAAMTTGPWATMSATARGKILRRIGDAPPQAAAARVAAGDPSERIEHDGGPRSAARSERVMARAGLLLPKAPRRRQSSRRLGGKAPSKQIGRAHV